ncbi:di-N-acetylchitobiase [Eurytemora carolleeae]|uniref:di-N-acetylchitobiase n=1 Tax=Eurytemora carolleeae TaxID=1294199 RepID=UPI000C764F2E|nr:di-N-acetylchitobiase [Eurytemora carolleeae]|eukprot:XP_023328046.1 di-N-acetylchitobiase-like [Eurytemora affinis]
MFQYEKLANIVDLVFITAYDTQSQMFETSCQARPNSPLRRIFSGIRKYVQLGIPVKKMILGVPWYGYRYPCESFNAGICFIKKVPFRGCNCSDAAGVEIPYKDILNFEKLSLTGRKWDAVSQTPYFEVTLNSTIYQIWFDDPSSLFIKYKVGTDLGLAGVGFWTANYLDYSNYTMVQSMWSILP